MPVFCVSTGKPARCRMAPMARTSKHPLLPCRPIGETISINSSRMAIQDRQRQSGRSNLRRRHWQRNPVLDGGNGRASSHRWSPEKCCSPTPRERRARGEHRGNFPDRPRGRAAPRKEFSRHAGLSANRTQRGEFPIPGFGQGGVVDLKLDDNQIIDRKPARGGLHATSRSQQHRYRRRRAPGRPAGEV